MAKIIECVPNFSEGRDKNVIDQIVKAIASAKVTVNGNEEGVKVLDVDPGEATNRTVVTFVGSPEAVLEAAFEGVQVFRRGDRHEASPRSAPSVGGVRCAAARTGRGDDFGRVRGTGARLAKGLRRARHPLLLLQGGGVQAGKEELAVSRAGEYEALPEKPPILPRHRTSGLRNITRQWRRAGLSMWEPETSLWPSTIISTRPQPAARWRSRSMCVRKDARCARAEA